MRFVSKGRGPGPARNYLASLFAALAFLAAALPAPADAKDRYAFLVGVGAYKTSQGVEPLLAPPNDVEELSIALGHKAINFEVETLKDPDITDKQAFLDALEAFLQRVQEGDEVLFYFSGHGYHVTEASNPSAAGNYLLLPTAKSQPSYLIDLQKEKPLEARELDTIAKKDRAYAAWIAETSPSESEIEAAIAKRKPSAIILIADANRILVSGTRDAAIVSGLVAPPSTGTGTFKLYSAGRGQYALERPEELSFRQQKSKDKGKSREGKSSKEKTAVAAVRNTQRRLTSLFTREFIRALPTPRLDISLLHAKVKARVREEARKAELLQVPALVSDTVGTSFKFWEGDDESEVALHCLNAKSELDTLRYGVISGVATRGDVEHKLIELAPCGLQDVVGSYLRLKQQGAGEGEVTATLRQDGTNHLQLCDELAASRFDRSRPQDIAGSEIQNTALKGLGSEEERVDAAAVIGQAIDVCTRAVADRPRVARYKYNLARANYALATISQGVARANALIDASKRSQEAAELGHAAAFHLLATLILNGEYAGPDGRPQAVDRRQGWTLMERGADIGHVLAQYELGLAYKNGDIEAETDILKEVKSDAKAYQYFARAAETGFLPAMIETALALRHQRGIERDTNRAIQILTLAASQGSPEAMYRLAQIYEEGGYLNESYRIDFDPSEATLWYSRAAEFGDVRAQAKLAEKLNEGYGLPARQPETAARYWRLAADGGSTVAQMQLANLLRDGQVPFRLKLGVQDSGAEEIKNLYLNAFARGNPIAGLELARLYRTGFPKGAGSAAIPRDPSKSVLLLWEMMSRVRLEASDSPVADPNYEFEAAKELISIYESNSTGEGSGSALISEDQIAQLKAEYGDPAKAFWIRVDALGVVQCSSGPGSYYTVDDLWVRIWDSTNLQSPTDRQFDWYEDYKGCKVRLGRETGKRRELGIPKKIREKLNKEYDAALKEREKKPDGYKRFTDRVAELMAKLDGKKKR